MLYYIHRLDWLRWSRFLVTSVTTDSQLRGSSSALSELCKKQTDGQIDGRTETDGHTIDGQKMNSQTRDRQTIDRQQSQKTVNKHKRQTADRQTQTDSRQKQTDRRTDIRPHSRQIMNSQTRDRHTINRQHTQRTDNRHKRQTADRQKQTDNKHTQIGRHRQTALYRLLIIYWPTWFALHCHDDIIYISRGKQDIKSR